MKPVMAFYCLTYCTAYCKISKLTIPVKEYLSSSGRKLSTTSVGPQGSSHLRGMIA